jgi:hypothetical protein
MTKMQPAPTLQKFQCYLILGTENIVREQTELLAKSHDINLNKVSPDIFLVSPAKQSISIEEIRNLKKHVFQKPVHLPSKIIIFKEAHKLTPEAQNALLKILEEPPANVIIILEAQNKENLLPTVRSRLVIIDTKREYETSQADFYLVQTLPKLLDALPEIKNPESWLDNQILLVHSQIIKNAKNSKTPPGTLLKALDMCIFTKKMIAANVNPIFALANLYFTTVKQQPKT